MSTVDTLITAVSTVVVKDVYRPYVAPKADERTLLRAARVSALAVTLLGVALVPVFAQFKTVYAAHGAMTAAVTPPLVVALLLSVFWRRYTRTAALWTIVGGLAAIKLSIFFPELIRPFAHGVPAPEAGDGLFAGASRHKFLRALFGLVVSGAIGVAVTTFTRPEPFEKMRGLVWGTVGDALAHYRSGAPHAEGTSAQAALARPETSALAPVRALDVEPRSGGGEAHLPGVVLGADLARALEAKVGDLVFLSDARRWLGGLRSAHAIVVGVVGVAGVDDAGGGDPGAIALGETLRADVVAAGREGRPVRVTRLY